MNSRKSAAILLTVLFLVLSRFSYGTELAKWCGFLRILPLSRRTYSCRDFNPDLRQGANSWDIISLIGRLASYEGKLFRFPDDNATQVEISGRWSASGDYVALRVLYGAKGVMLKRFCSRNSKGSMRSIEISEPSP